MRAGLLFATALAACWTGTGGPALPPPRARPAPACTEAGDRLLLVTCRDGNALAWTVTNQTLAPLWAFVAPPAFVGGRYARANAIAVSDNGRVALAKTLLPPIGGELRPVGAVALAPGASDRGTIPIGERIDAHARNFAGARVRGSTWVMSVTLEVGFADRRAGDETFPAGGRELVLLPMMDPARQEIVRAPPVPWH